MLSMRIIIGRSQIMPCEYSENPLRVETSSSGAEEICCGLILVEKHWQSRVTSNGLAFPCSSAAACTKLTSTLSLRPARAAKTSRSHAEAHQEAEVS